MMNMGTNHLKCSKTHQKRNEIIFIFNNFFPFVKIIQFVCKKERKQNNHHL